MKIAAIGLLAVGAAYALIAPLDRVRSGSRMDVPSNVRSMSQAALLNGVWRSRGYGWVVEIYGGRARFYDATETTCLPRKERVSVLADISDWFKLSDDEDILQIPLYDPAYLFTFDRIEELPEICNDNPDDDPKAVLDALIALFSEHYAFIAERDVDWDRLAAQSRIRLALDPSEKRLLEVVGEIVASIDDPHVRLIAKLDGKKVVREAGDGPTQRRMAEQAERENLTISEMRERWEKRYSVGDMEAILEDDKVRRALDGLMIYGLIGEDKDIGYVAFTAMEGFTRRRGDTDADIRALDKAMENVFDLFEDVDAVIVDISMNDGGYDMVARALASRFASERVVGYSKYAGDADEATPQAIFIEPNKGRRYTGPVYLLTSDYTLSAAEVFTMAMRALPNVTHVGQATRGALSDTLSKALPNGWSLTLSNEVYLDSKGRYWEGTGIPPKIAIEVFSPEDVMRGHVEAVHRIVELIRSGG